MICFPNLAVREGVVALPWEFSYAPETLTALKALPKAARTKHLMATDTKWSAYSVVRGMVSNQRVTAASGTNPAAVMDGFVADYDAVATTEAVTGFMAQLKAHFKPTYAERSLGNKWRLVWLFEKSIMLPDERFGTELFMEIAKLLDAPRIMAGYDPASTKLTQVWVNGGEWFEVGGKLSAEILTGIAVKAATKRDESSTEVPLHIIAEEVAARFPGRWEGDFVIGSSGVRFWDEKADNAKGAYVCKTGCYCFTGPKAFVGWGEIFGPQWVNEQRAVQAGKAAEDIYHDGRAYWTSRLHGRWMTVTRENLMIHLASQGLQRKVPKGRAVSEVESVLEYINTVNRVCGAVPLVFRPSGIIHLNGERLLNVSSIKALPPSKGGDFPWIDSFLKGLFARPEDKPLEHMLAWLQRAYRGALENRPLSGQAVFLCGPKNNGKTLFCDKIVAPLLGGKAANPYDYLMKSTAFNKEIFSVGLLAINDDAAPHGERERENMLQGLKALVVNARHMYHPKFSDRVEIEWFGRIIVTLNDDAKSVGILPELNANTEDKLMFFASQPYGGDFPDRYTLEDTIAHELPHFAAHLLALQPDPDVLASDRMGVAKYHDKHIVELSRQQENAFNLLELLRTWFNEGAYWQPEEKHEEWEGTPTDLMSQLSTSGSSIALLKDWTVARVAKGLTSLARRGQAGVEARGNRTFKIVKTV